MTGNGVAGDGIFADTNNTGKISIVTAGLVSGKNFGVNAKTSSGANAITIGSGGVLGALDGVFAISATGEIKIDGTGDATGTAGRGIFASTGGAVTITTTGAVSGGFTGIFAESTNAKNVTVTGTGAVIGTNGGGIVASSNGGDVTVGPASTVTGNGVAGDGIFAQTNNIGKVTITTAGLVSGKVNGINLIAATGNVQVANNATVTGITNAILGSTTGSKFTLDNNGTLNGSVNVTGSAVATSLFTNSGIWNNGTLNSSFAGGLSNSGTVSTQDGVAGNTTITVVGDYVGVGGVLGVDAFLGGPGSLADKLLITGNSSGTTALKVNDTNLADGALNPAGITVVKVSGTANAADFTLSGGPINKGLFQYSLNFDAGTEIFALVSSSSVSGKQLGSTVDSAQDIWHDTLMSWMDHQDSLRDAVSASGQVTAVADPPLAGGFDPQNGLWMAVRGSWTNARGHSGAPGFKQDTLFLNGGADFGVSNNDSKLLFGVLAGYIDSDVGLKGSSTKISYTGGSVGAYADYLRQGFFFNNTAKLDVLRMHYNDPILGPTGKATSDVTSLGFRSDMGYRIENGGAFVEPMISGAAVWTDIDDFALGGSTIHPGTNDSLRLGAGARFGMDANNIDFALTARVWDELASSPSVTVLSGGPALAISGGNFKGVFGEVGGHINYDFSDQLSVFADGGVLFGKKTTTASAQGGVTFKW